MNAIGSFVSQFTRRERNTRQTIQTSHTPSPLKSSRRQPENRHVFPKTNRKTHRQGRSSDRYSGDRRCTFAFRTSYDQRRIRQSRGVDDAISASTVMSTVTSSTRGPPASFSQCSSYQGLKTLPLCPLSVAQYIDGYECLSCCLE